MRGTASRLARIALDPDQFGRTAADVEQDGAASLGIEQRRTADHGQCGFGLAIDHLELDAGLGRNPVHEAVGVRRRAAGFGCDQPQPLCLFRLDLVAADAQRRDGAIDRGLADAAGRRNPLAQPDDPGERIDHAKSVAGRTGDQKTAVVGAEVERSVDAGARRRPRLARRRPPRPSLPGLRAAQGRREAAYHHSSNVFPRPVQADEEFPFTETLAAREARRNSRSHGTMPNQALSLR